MVELLKKYAVWAVFGLVIVFSFVFINKDNNESEFAADGMKEITAADLEQKETSTAGAENGKVIIDIKGEVKHPGVYEMDASDRIHHVIDKAGGFTDGADQTQVNLAQRVVDEMVIYIPKQGEGDVELPVGASSEGASEGKLRINYATKEELETLSGIGPSKAEAIMKHREENGLFQTPEDLLEVSGIGEKTLENFKDEIIVP